MYGFGMLAYFDLLRYLMIIFLIINIMFLPIMFIYYQNNGMSSFRSSLSMVNSLSIANLGQAGTKCVHQYVGIGSKQEKLFCERGKIKQLLHWGVIPVKEENDSFSLNHCYDTKSHPEIDDCSIKHFNSINFQDDFKTKCIDKQTCQISMMDQFDFGNTDSKCTKPNAKVYLQYVCDYKEITKDQQKIGLLIACVTILSSTLMYLGIYYA